MDWKTTLPSQASHTYDERMKQLAKGILISRKLIIFLILTVLVNSFLTYNLIFHQPRSAPSLADCAKHIQAQCGTAQLSLPTPGNIARSNVPDLYYNGKEDGSTESTALAVRPRGELSERMRLVDIRDKMNIGAVYAWPLIQGMAWWNMIAACKDFKNGANPAVNCLWGAITSVITLAGVGLRTAIWLGYNTDIYNGAQPRSIHPQIGGSVYELGQIIGHNVTYHGIWDHAKLGLNYSEETMENEDPLHVFGIVSPDGTESHFSYVGNGTGKHVFKLGFGAPTPDNRTSAANLEVHGRGTVTIGNQYFAWGGIDFMVDPNKKTIGYLDYVAPDWNAVLAQVSCLWGSDPLSDDMLAAGHYFQIRENIVLDTARETMDAKTVARGAMSIFWGSHKSLLPGMMNIPPVPEGKCAPK